MIRSSFHTMNRWKQEGRWTTSARMCEKGAEATDSANTDNKWHKEVDAHRKIGMEKVLEVSRRWIQNIGLIRRKIRNF